MSVYTTNKAITSFITHVHKEMLHRRFYQDSCPDTIYDPGTHFVVTRKALSKASTNTEGFIPKSTNYNRTKGTLGYLQSHGRRVFLCTVRADLGGVDCCQAVGQCGTCVEGFFHVSAPLLGPAKELCTMRSVQVLGTLFL